MNATIIDVVQNAYGYNLVFSLQNPDGTAFNLTNATTIKINVQQANTSGLKFSVAIAKSGNPTDGLATYGVRQGDFDLPGTYLAQIEADFSDAVQVWPNITIRAYKQLPNF